MLNSENSELLNLLSEECAEVIVAVSKINRFGFDSSHPNRPEKNNLDDLEEELGDLLCVINLLNKKQITIQSHLETYSLAKENKIRQYSQRIEL